MFKIRHWSRLSYAVVLVVSCSGVSGSSIDEHAALLKAQLREGLVAEYLFEKVHRNPDGDVVVGDTSGNGFDALSVMSNGQYASYPDDLLPVDLDRGGGVHALAAQFDSTERQFVHIPYDAAFDFENGYTLMAWIKHRPDVTPLRAGQDRAEVMERGGAYWINIRQFQPPAQPVPPVLRVGGFFQPCDVALPANTPGGRWHFIDSITPIRDDEWTHVASIYDGVTLRVYINGVLDAQKTIGQKVCVGWHNPLTLGAKYNPLTPPPGVVTNDAFLNGAIDEVRVYNRPLSEDELLTLMSTPPMND